MERYRQIFIFIFFTLIILPTPKAFSKSSNWHVSYQAGQFDEYGNYMGGTELMNLVAHKGKLYAGNGYLADRIGYMFGIGAQVLVKETTDSRWKVDCQFPSEYERVEFLMEAIFSTEGNGENLASPVSMLVAAPGSYVKTTGKGAIYSRNDETGEWSEMAVSNQSNVIIRAIEQHRDQVTGADLLFVACQPGGIFRGEYDDSVAGNIKWHQISEFDDYETRPMALAECNDKLYASIPPAIYCRTDGTTPGWQIVYQYDDPESFDPSVAANSGMRGLTPVENPDGNGESLLMVLEGFESKVVRLDPMNDHEETLELDLITFLEQEWGVWWDRTKIKYVIGAYNNMTKVTDPTTDEEVLLIGLGAYKNKPVEKASSWYLVRSKDASYSLHEIPAIPSLRRSTFNLLGCRTIALSPFEATRGKEVYFGGYTIVDKLEHNTSWIYKTSLSNIMN